MASVIWMTREWHRSIQIILTDIFRDIQHLRLITQEKRFRNWNQGAWHDAGDFDLRVESQSETVLGLTLAYEQFNEKYDNTTIDQRSHIVEIQQPDGKPDLLQQIEHGLLSIIGGYKSMGRFYRGIIEPSLRQYTVLGDAVNITDGKPAKCR